MHKNLAVCVHVLLVRACVQRVYNLSGVPVNRLLFTAHRENNVL